MKVLIAGATGLVGRGLVTHLWSQGHDIVVLARNPLQARNQFAVPVHVEGWDGKSPLEPTVFRGIEAVINLAGAPIATHAWTQKRRREILESRTDSTRAIAEGLKACSTKPSVWVQASAIGYYGDRGTEILDEKGAPGDGFLAEVCREWEAATVGAPNEVRVVRLRTATVLSRLGGAFPLMLLPFQLKAGAVLGCATSYQSWIHIEDLHRLIVFCMENAISGAVVAAAPEPVTQVQVAKELARVTRTKVRLRIPKFFLRALGRRRVLLTDSQKACPRVALDAGFTFRFSSFAAAVEDLVKVDPLASVLERQQWVPQPVDQVFPFFSDEKNLEALTPPWLNFHVVGKSSESVEAGTTIDYRLKIRGVPVRWRSQIEAWKPGVRFVDRQLRGPYAFWHHDHAFESVRGGTLLSDKIHFRVPGGTVGKLWLEPWVRRDVEKIFDFRTGQVRGQFRPPG